jgi:hypothetical protein
MSADAPTPDERDLILTATCCEVRDEIAKADFSTSHVFTVDQEARIREIVGEVFGVPAAPRHLYPSGLPIPNDEAIKILAEFASRPDPAIPAWAFRVPLPHSKPWWQRIRECFRRGRSSRA